MDLTPRERQAYDLRHTDPKTPFRAVASQMGISVDGAKRFCKRAKFKLENPDQVSQAGKDQTSRRLEYTDPDKAAEFIDAISDPLLKSVAEAARDCNLPTQATRKLMDRLNGQLSPLVEKTSRVKTETLVRGFEQLALRAQQAITDDKLEELNGYQLTLVSAIATDKRELLDGRPTERISHEDRRKLPEMMAELLKEGARRGLMEQINPETNISVLVDREDAPYQVRAGREAMPK